MNFNIKIKGERGAIDIPQFMEQIDEGKLKLIQVDYDGVNHTGEMIFEKVEFRQCYYDKFHVSQIEMSHCGVGYGEKAKFIKKIWIVYEGKFEWCKWNDSLIFENEEIANKVCKKLNEVKR